MGNGHVDMQRPEFRRPCLKPFIQTALNFGCCPHTPSKCHLALGRPAKYSRRWLESGAGAQVQNVLVWESVETSGLAAETTLTYEPLGVTCMQYTLAYTPDRQKAPVKPQLGTPAHVSDHQFRSWLLYFQSS